MSQQPPPPNLPQPSYGARFSIFYITVGALLLIWSGVWYYWIRVRDAAPPGDGRYFVCTGLFLSGLAVLIIGLLIGRIGQEAKNADVPVGPVTGAVVVPQAGQPNAGGTAPAGAPAPAVMALGVAP